MLTIAEALSCAKPVDRPGFDQAFEVSPDDLFPAMLPLVASETAPVLDGGANRDEYSRRLANVRRNAEAIADASLPISEFLCDDDTPKEERVARNARRAARAQVLELARLWFTAELHAQFPEGTVMVLKIVVAREACEACEGAGKLEAGKTAILVDCPVCKGAGSNRVVSRWKQ